VVDLAKYKVSEQCPHLRDHPRIDLPHLYVNPSHRMLRVPINPVHAGQQLDRTLAPEPGPVGVRQRVIGPVMIVCRLGEYMLLFFAK
jgi:hypothetical protein